MLNQRIARFTALAVEHDFLYWILRSNQFRNQIEHTTQGTKVQHLYNSDLDRVQLGVPQTASEQNGIIRLLNISSDKVVKNEAYLEKLIQLKSGLMNDLLTGKVQVAID
jgi:type I restriction enzyme, S subunit